MTAYYIAVESLLKLMGYKRERIFSLARLLGNIRYHVGYIGKGKSKALFLKEISRVFPEKNEIEKRIILKNFWIMHQKSFLDFFMAYRLEKDNYHNTRYRIQAFSHMRCFSVSIRFIKQCNRSQDKIK